MTAVSSCEIPILGPLGGRPDSLDTFEGAVLRNCLGFPVHGRVDSLRLWVTFAVGSVVDRWQGQYVRLDMEDGTKGIFCQPSAANGRQERGHTYVNNCYDFTMLIVRRRHSS